MAEGFGFTGQAVATFENQDQNVEWFSKVATSVCDSLQCYYEYHRDDIENYRPISILSPFNKIFKIMLRKTLIKFLDKKYFK